MIKVKIVKVMHPELIGCMTQNGEDFFEYRCKVCGSEKTKVMQTYVRYKDCVKIRRRKCLVCGCTWNTVEVAANIVGTGKWRRTRRRKV